MDFLVTITYPIQITAKNFELAEERAEQIAAAMEVNLKAKWLGDMDQIETTVEEI